MAQQAKITTWCLTFIHNSNTRGSDPSSGFHGHPVHTWYTHMYTCKHTHKIKVNKCLLLCKGQKWTKISCPSISFAEATPVFVPTRLSSNQWTGNVEIMNNCSKRPGFPVGRRTGNEDWWWCWSAFTQLEASCSLVLSFGLFFPLFSISFLWASCVDFPVVPKDRVGFLETATTICNLLPWLNSKLWYFPETGRGWGCWEKGKRGWGLHLSPWWRIRLEILLSKGVDVFSLSFFPRELGEHARGAWAG